MQNSMQEVSRQISKYRGILPQGVQLVAVSKFHPAEAVAEAYAAGQRIFGESRADELVAKAAALPDDIKWHFIGHLQTNKVRRIIPHVDTIQSVDSERLLRLIDEEALRACRTTYVLLQVHVAAEESKTGFTPDELLQVAARYAHELRAIRIKGVMGMATNTDDSDRINADFQAIAATSQRLRQILPEATEISMGMSGDFMHAIAHGATMVRIGTDIFGSRY